MEPHTLPFPYHPFRSFTCLSSHSFPPLNLQTKTWRKFTENKFNDNSVCHISHMLRSPYSFLVSFRFHTHHTSNKASLFCSCYHRLHSQCFVAYLYYTIQLLKSAFTPAITSFTIITVTFLQLTEFATFVGRAIYRPTLCINASPRGMIFLFLSR